MELELNMTHQTCYEAVLDTTVSCEETLESIVPDACPDILRIVDTEALYCLKTKEAMEGRVEVTGSARVAILYCPDGGEGLRRMTVTIPITCTVEAPGITGRCRVIARPSIQSVDARSLNPRKVLTRVNIILSILVYAPQSATICDKAMCSPEGGVQQLSETHHTSVITAVEEKPFTFSDDIALSGSKAQMEELLKMKVELRCNDSKMIGNKLIFKGQAELQLLYRDPTNNLCTADFELPFSQIMEVSGVEEDANCTLSILLTGCECTTTDDGDGRTISVSLGMLAQASIREEQQITLLTDSYSTTYALAVERRHYLFHRMVEDSGRRITVREIIETITPAKVAYDISVHVGGVHQSREGEIVTLTADTTVTVLYVDEDGTPATIVRTIPTSCQIELSEDCICTCYCVCPGDRFATPAGAGVEVRYPIDFSWLALSPRRTIGITELNLDESAPRDTANQPSIVLRMVSEGEQLWDIAKAYGTTMDEIVRANALTEETLPLGQLLLIPKKR